MYMEYTCTNKIKKEEKNELQREYKSECEYFISD